MPNTRKAKVGKAATKPKSMKGKRDAEATMSTEVNKTNEVSNFGKLSGEETAYERRLRKVNENKKRKAQDKDSNKSKRSKSIVEGTLNVPQNSSQHSRFCEDDNYVDMDVTGIQNEFPSEDEDEEGW